jgi:hypothetical protein
MNLQAGRARSCHDPCMTTSSADRETFSLGWLKMPGESREIVGSVTLPGRPTTLGEARGGLEMVGSDELTTSWLRRWAEVTGEERSILLHLPGGWFALRSATVTLVPGELEHYLVRFDRRSADTGPAA